MRNVPGQKNFLSTPNSMVAYEDLLAYLNNIEQTINEAAAAVGGPNESELQDKLNYRATELREWQRFIRDLIQYYMKKEGVTFTRGDA